VGYKFTKKEIALILTNGLNSAFFMFIDASVGGTMKNKTAAEI